MYIRNIIHYLFPSDLLYSVCQSVGPSKLLQKALFHSFYSIMWRGQFPSCLQQSEFKFLLFQCFKSPKLIKANLLSHIQESYMPSPTEWDWDDWVTSLTQWAWFWASSRRWWWSGKSGVLHGVAESDTTERLNSNRIDLAIELSSAGEIRSERIFFSKGLSI